MKRSLLLIVFPSIVLLCTLPLSLTAENHARQQGTIVRMRMTECMGSQHSFMTAMSGAQAAAAESCPEYVLVTGTVVYVIIGKSSDQLVPLAESTNFHFQHNEVLIRVDDARKESRFHVKEMVLRPQWDLNQKMVEAEAVAAMHHHLEGGVVMVEARQ